MGAILAENELHHAYWRSTSKPTISTDAGGQKSGFEFVNMFDNNAHTSFKNNTSTQSVMRFDFGSTRNFNGFAVYGHNLTTSQAIKIEYSTDNSSYTTFTDSAVYPANGEISPANNNGEAFCVYLKGSSNIGRYWRITTIGWDTSTFITTLALGSFVDNVNISAPYTMPSFTPQEVSIKRNNQGNLLSSDVRKIPQKLNIKLTTLQESDLDATQSGITNTTINGLTATYSFIDYLGHFVSRFPFFVLHDDGGDGSNTEKKADRNKVYFCTIDKSLKQPAFASPTTLNWSINAIGYIS
jgi:hypothetical protein